jgi:hypothetical protein
MKAPPVAPPVPPPFVCADGRTIAVAPWTYSAPGGPFRSSIEMSKDGVLLDSVDVDISRDEVSRARNVFDLHFLLLTRVEEALFELARRMPQ